jgi:hypothetical protein
MKPDAPVLQSTRLVDQVRERIRYMHYSLKTEKAYLYWARFFIRWSATQPGGMRHPRDMGVQDVEAFLSMMAKECKLFASTQPSAQFGAVFVPRSAEYRFTVAEQHRATSTDQAHSLGFNQGRSSGSFGTDGRH